MWYVEKNNVYFSLNNLPLSFKDERAESKRSSNWFKVLLKAVSGNRAK